jgi:hypothetical protein
MLVKNPVFEERVEIFEKLFSTTKWKKTWTYGGGGDGCYFIFTDIRNIMYRVPDTGKVYDFTKLEHYTLSREYKYPTLVI